MDYVLDAVKMGSPLKYKDANYMASRLMNVDSSPVIHHKIRNFDKKFDGMWEDTMHGYPIQRDETHAFNVSGDLSG